MGSMAARELARRGHRVTGFDRFHPPHDRGSSHGLTRIIREAYFEHPQYVPLVQRAYDCWKALEAEAGLSLYRPTGGLMIGPPGGVLVTGARTSALTHGLPFEELTAGEVSRRFPFFSPGPGEVGLFEPRAGVLFPEPAIGAALRLAAAAGAALHPGQPLIGWRKTPGESGITVITGQGSYSVDRLVLATGAWMKSELAPLDVPLDITRQPLFWFEVPPRVAGSAARIPVFIWEWEPGRMFYGFPDLGDGVKVAIHHEGESVDPDVPRRAAEAEEANALAGVLTNRLSGLGPVREATTCLYTSTRTGDFVIDRHPHDDRVIIASPCSGHGFKFAPVIGEVIADLVENRPPAFDLGPFRLARASGR